MEDREVCVYVLENQGCAQRFCQGEGGWFQLVLGRIITYNGTKIQLKV